MGSSSFEYFMHVMASVCQLMSITGRRFCNNILALPRVSFHLINYSGAQNNHQFVCPQPTP